MKENKKQKFKPLQALLFKLEGSPDLAYFENEEQIKEAIIEKRYVYADIYKYSAVPPSWRHLKTIGRRQ